MRPGLVVLCSLAFVGAAHAALLVCTEFGGGGYTLGPFITLDELTPCVFAVGGSVVLHYRVTNQLGPNLQYRVRVLGGGLPGGLSILPPSKVGKLVATNDFQTWAPTASTTDTTPQVYSFSIHLENTPSSSDTTSFTYDLRCPTTCTLTAFVPTPPTPPPPTPPAVPTPPTPPPTPPPAAVCQRASGIVHEIYIHDAAGASKFVPETTHAMVGDRARFYWNATATVHNAKRVEDATSCLSYTPNSDFWSSGATAKSGDFTTPPFTMPPSGQTIFYGCKQHCDTGHRGVIVLDNTVCQQGTPPPCSPGSLTVNVVVSGGAGANMFMPSSASGGFADSVKFTWSGSSDLHRIVQTATADSCIPLAGGVNSGAASTSGSFTYQNIQQVVFFFMDEVWCQSGEFSRFIFDGTAAYCPPTPPTPPPPTPCEPTTPQVMTLTIVGQTFAPSSTVHLATGDSVRFVWTTGSHRFYQTDGPSSTTALSGGWESGATASGTGDYTTPSIATTQYFACSVHPSMLGTALVDVARCTPPTPPTPPPTTAPSTTAPSTTASPSEDCLGTGISCLILGSGGALAALCCCSAVGSVILVILICLCMPKGGGSGGGSGGGLTPFGAEMDARDDDAEDDNEDDTRAFGTSTTTTRRHVRLRHASDLDALQIKV